MLLTSNRAAAFLHLVKLNKALADAETTISLKPDWEKVQFLHTYGSYFDVSKIIYFSNDFGCICRVISGKDVF